MRWILRVKLQINASIFGCLYWPFDRLTTCLRWTLHEDKNKNIIKRDGKMAVIDTGWNYWLLNVIFLCLTWTFLRATEVLSKRYLARYTSLNWPRPIFFSIWKFANELWPISGCKGFWKKEHNNKLTCVRKTMCLIKQHMHTHLIKKGGKKWIKKILQLSCIYHWSKLSPHYWKRKG